MANNNSIDILKKAFNDGYEAFKVVVQNDKGVYQNPTNSYQKGSLPFKEWQRGYDRAFTDNQRKVS